MEKSVYYLVGKEQTPWKNLIRQYPEREKPGDIKS